MSRNKQLAFQVSLSALMAAVGVVIMLSSNLIPILTYVAPLLASLTLLPPYREFGRKYAWMTWCATALLALLLCTDREAAFFYLFIGYYPILKPMLDRIPSKPLRFLAKLALFSAVFMLLFLLLAFVLGLEDFRSELLLSAGVYAILVVTMIFFDRAIGNAAMLYEKRLREKLFRNPQP